MIPLYGALMLPERRWHPVRSIGWVLLAVLVVLGLGATAGPASPALATVPGATRVTAASAATVPSPVTTAVNADFDGLDRQYTTIVPRGGGRALPMVVFVGGTSATTSQEVARDELLPFVRAGLVSLVYPIGINRQWTITPACCSAPKTPKTDDVGYVRAVTRLAAATIHPDGARIYLMGYSSGAKLAWQLICARTGPFAALATFGGNPETACPARGTPLPVLIGFGARDVNEPIAGRKSDKRGTHPPAAVNLDLWLTRDGCASAKPRVARLGVQVSITGWRPCVRPGVTVQYGLWLQSSHTLPYPPSVTLPASFGQVAWKFVQKFRRP